MGCYSARPWPVWLYSRGGVVPGVWAHTAGGSAALGLLGLLLAAPLIPGYVYGVTALAAVATAGLILAIVAEGPRVTRWLAAGWLVRIGWISYGVYLWHFPVFVQFGVLRQAGESAAPLGRTALAWGLTFAVALCSYVLIERPFLQYKPRLSADLEIEPAPAVVVPPATKNGLALPTL